ncbi:hypothetical protein [Actinophytocola sp.]|uniref:hypothetical protein n=1 Tax=Actinophytocola sp. TaxID=1872138 RepID=UPI002ED14C3E
MTATQERAQRPAQETTRRPRQLLAAVLAHVRGWCWPLTPATVVVPAALIVVVVVVMTAPMWGWPYPLWVQTSAQFHQQFTWAGLIAGTSACWYATQLHAPDRIWIQPHAPRLGAPAVHRHLRLLVSWFVGAYLVALTPLVVATMVAGGLGSPDPLAMLSGVLAMVAAVALGYALGTVVPLLVMVPITAAGFYALLVVGHAGGDSYAAVAPALHLEPELGQRESPALLVFRIAVFVAVAVMATGLATRRLQRLAFGGSPVWQRVVDVVIHAATPAVLITVSLVNKPALFEVDVHPDAACTVQREIRYCVHADQQLRLAALVDTVDPVIARYGATPDLLTQVWDQSLAWGPIDRDLARGLQLAWLRPDGTIQTDIAIVLSGLYSCSLDPAAPDTAAGTASDDGGDGAGGTPAEAQTETLAAVPGDILTFLEGDPPSGTFAGMTVPQVQQWLDRHQRALHTCTLTTEDLPQP